MVNQAWHLLLSITCEMYLYIYTYNLWSFVFLCMYMVCFCSMTGDGSDQCGGMHVRTSGFPWMTDRDKSW